MTPEVLRYLPESIDLLRLDLVKQGIVGDSIFSILSSCAKRFYDGNGKRNHKAWNFSQDVAESCRFLLDFTWEELNTGHWKDVDLSWRYLYSYASLFQVLNDLLSKERNLKEICLTCDMGLLMGAPVLNNSLAKIASYVAKEINKAVTATASTSSPNVKKHCFDVQVKAESAIPLEVCPSLECFSREYYHAQKPVLIQAALQDWPALTDKQWSVDYILQVAGCRTVPIEIGNKYTDESWSQKLMTLNEFAERFILSKSPEGVAYCAQHQLLTQIEDLADDVTTPVYCCLGEEEEPDINCWFGPAGTVSPLHFDPRDNCLTQVFGKKYIRLYSPEATAMLYPHDSHLLDNTSQVDLENPDLEKFPLFGEAAHMECVLKEGELLFIPKKWWHFVRSLDNSFSISFWF